MNAGSFDIPKSDERHLGVLPLSYSQLCFWFVYFALGETANNLSRLMVEGEVNVAVVEETLNRIIGRHEVLRARIGEINPVQNIQKPEPFDLPYRDLGGCSEERKAEIIKQRVVWMMSPFDLQHPPLLRVFLYRLEPRQYLLLSCFPHIALDGGGVHLYENEFLETYNAIVGGKNPYSRKERPLQISDYVRWERHLGNQVFARQREFWQRALRGCERAHFPQHLLANRVTAHYDRLVEIPAEVMESLRSMCTAHKATLQMCLIGIVGLVLKEVTSAPKMVINSVMENRVYKGTDTLFAPLLHAVPVPLNIAAGATLAEVVEQVKKHLIGACDNTRIPLSVAVGILARKRWKNSYALLVKAIDTLSFLFAKICRRAELYPSFLSDYLLTIDPPEKFRLKHLLKRNRPTRKEGVSEPTINVNILQSFFKHRADTGAGEGAIRIRTLNDSEKYLPDVALDGNWENDTINFYITAGEDGASYMRIICCCLNENGVAALEDGLKFTMKSMKGMKGMKNVI